MGIAEFRNLFCDKRERVSVAAKFIVLFVNAKINFLLNANRSSDKKRKNLCIPIYNVKMFKSGKVTRKKGFSFMQPNKRSL
jgi:hypothetical protein